MEEDSVAMFQVDGLNMEDRRAQMVQLYTCTSQLETLRVQEHARTQDLATGRSGGDWSWTRAQIVGERWHARGGSAAHARLCARPMARSRMLLRALDRANQGGWRSSTLGRQNDQEAHKEWDRSTSQIGLEGLLELDQRSLARTVL